MAGVYVGRFAPSPTGLLHAGSLVAALASWLDAKAHAGHWLVRIEDVDTPRCIAAASQAILQQLSSCGLHADADVVWQSQRGHLYTAALEQLRNAGHTYGCSCSRQDIAQALKAQGTTPQKHQAAIYPGTCRHAQLPNAANSQALAWRCLVPQAPNDLQHWTDRRLGTQRQHLATEVGDFVLWRKDQLWAYQLAVVVDDAAQGITHVVRGQDLADNTARQLWLQQCLGLPAPRYLHTPLVLAADGDKLSKQNGAKPLALSSSSQVQQALAQAAKTLGLAPAPQGSVAEQLAWWVAAWRAAYNA